MKKPTPAQIDDLVRRYTAADAKAERARKLAKLRDERVAVLKVELTALVEEFGARHTEKSKRLAGVHGTATTTTATMTAVVNEAVDALRGELEKKDLVDVQGVLFTRHVTYQLIQAPGEVLKTLELTARVRNRLQVLISACFRITPKKPSLKVDLVEPNKIAA